MINDLWLRIIYWCKYFPIYVKAFCWVYNNILHNELARECVDRFPWEYAKHCREGQSSPDPPIVKLLEGASCCPCFVTNQEEFDEFVFYVTWWFIVLCWNPVFEIYRAGGVLGLGVRTRIQEHDETWTVDQIRSALFMILVEVPDSEDFLKYVRYKFPSMYQTSAMEGLGIGCLSIGPGQIINSTFNPIKKEQDRGKWDLTQHKVSLNNKGKYILLTSRYYYIKYNNIF